MYLNIGLLELILLVLILFLCIFLRI